MLMVRRCQGGAKELPREVPREVPRGVPWEVPRLSTLNFTLFNSEAKMPKTTLPHLDTLESSLSTVPPPLAPSTSPSSPILSPTNFTSPKPFLTH